MLYIDNSLEQELKKKYPGFEVNAYCPYRSRQTSRYIQIFIDGCDHDLHYEYIIDSDWKGRVELHFEGNWEEKFGVLIDKLINKTQNRDELTWDEWEYRYRCRHSKKIDTIEELFQTMSYMMNVFDDLIKNLLVESPTSEKQTIPSDENTDVSEITASFVKLHECLAKSLKIPEYQRPYRWNVNNVEQLLNDIKNSRDNGKPIYLIGSIILHKKGNDYDIVDGQQRITSIILLLKNLKVNNLPNLQYNHNDSFRHIKDNYDYIERWLNSNVSNRKEFSEYIINNCMFVEIIVTKLEEAFQMFESQNGRGKELEAYNLLKAYHIRAMASSTKEDKINCDKQWEDATMFISQKGQRKDLLLQLFNEQLYRTRLWSNYEDAYFFSKKSVDEFKGVSLGKEHSLDFPYQNIFIQQEIATQITRNLNMNLFKVKGRFIHGDSENMNPFVCITQLILNGKPFFEYIETYVEIYKKLFLQLDSSQMVEFKEFYEKHCHYPGYNRRIGDGYIREVYKSAIIYVFDRFGEIGVNAIYKELYMCIYRHRLEKRQVRYATMAKAENSAWIFRTIRNAKNIANLNPIKQLALKTKYTFDNNEESVQKIIEEVLSVYINYNK